MEAKYDNWQEILFNFLSETYMDTSGRATLSFRCSLDTVKKIDPYLDTLIKNNIAKEPTIIKELNHSIITVELIEPRYSYYSYHNMGKLNKNSFIAHIGELVDSAPIDINRNYLCSLTIEEERYIHINWDNSRLLIYDLGNKTSSKKRKVISELIKSGKITTYREIRIESPETSIDGYKSYKDMLTTSFLQKNLKKFFLITDAKDNIGIRKSAYIKGLDLIIIIRQQLSRIEKNDIRHFKSKNLKINSSEIIDYFENLKNRQD